jgi:hypothetical protein
MPAIYISMESIPSAWDQPELIEVMKFQVPEPFLTAWNMIFVKWSI